jgi:hypothetical protein
MQQKQEESHRDIQVKLIQMSKINDDLMETNFLFQIYLHLIKTRLLYLVLLDKTNIQQLIYSRVKY